MKLLLYLYDNLLLILYFGVSLLALCSYLSERCRISVCLSALYLCLSVNQLVASMVEFLPEFSRFYLAVYFSMPVWNTVISVSAAVCLLNLGYQLSHISKLPFHEYMILCIFIFLLLLIPTLKSSRTTLFLYSSLFPLSLLYRGFSFHTLMNQAACSRSKKLFSDFRPVLSRSVLLFSLSGIMENYIRIFIFPARNGLSFCRIFSIDLLFGISALVYLCFFLRKTAAPHTCKAAVNSQEQVPESFTSPDTESASYYSFCKAHSLTLREQTILTELLNRTTDEQISAKLLISSFTVRSHVHNLLKKTGAKSRQELYALYESMKKQKSG
ncbi:helix-turn-helix transcriptional regulator [Lachnospiraceae bacterium 54-53]